jgi:hypothetical protein
MAAASCRDPGSGTNPLPLPVARIRITPVSVEVVNGGSVILSAVLLSAAGDTLVDVDTVQWTPRNGALARVSSTGVHAASQTVVTVSATVIGSTYVIADVGGVSDSALVVVTALAPTYYLWPTGSAIVPGLSRTLRVESFTNATGIRFASGSASWSSSDAAVASVDSNGVVTAHVTGHVTITAALTGQTVTADVEVFSYPSPLRFVSLSVGDGFVCGVTTTSEAYCWGSNVGGRLGTNAVMDQCERDAIIPPQLFSWSRSTYSCSGIPRKVNVGASVRDVQASFGGACALTTTSSVVCWGTEYGLAGSSPTVRPGATLSSLSLGTQGCGIGIDSMAYCWTSGDALPIGSRSDWRAISTRVNGTCALDTTGQPSCWGSPPVTGVAGAVSISAPTPVAVDARYAGVRFTQLVATGGHNCALSTDGQLYCWGGDEGGGRAVGITPTVPQVVGGLVSVSAPIDISPGHLRPICALTRTGDAYCVEYNRTAPADSAFPLLPLSVGVPLKMIAYRTTISCGIGIDGYAYCWGGAGDGEPSMFGIGAVNFIDLPIPIGPQKIIGQP